MGKPPSTPHYLTSEAAWRVACMDDALGYRQFRDVRRLVGFVRFVLAHPRVRSAFVEGIHSPAFVVYQIFEEWQAAQSLPVVDLHDFNGPSGRVH